jgi:predicted alpha/beta superfamily hydrolase
MIHKTYLILVSIFFIFIHIGNTQSNYLVEIGNTETIKSTVLNEDRTYYVQLPQNFNENKKYPVVYVLDGGVLLNAVHIVHDYYYGGYMPEMIIIGVANAKNRTRDLTTSKITERHGLPYNEQNGEADVFSDFLINELIPHIESNYPVTKYRSIIGHSYGGLFAANMLVNYTDVFENYLLIDPSLDWDNQRLLKDFELELSKRKFEGKNIYLALGGQLHLQNKEITIENVMDDTSEYTLFARSNIGFYNLVKSQETSGLDMNWKYYKNDLHGTVPLPSILDGLKYFFEWYQIENPELFNSPDTPIEDLVALIRKREQKLKKYFGYCVAPFEQDLFNMLGYMNLEMGQPNKSLTFFNLNIEYYPESANAYDSLADYYMSQNDVENALKNVNLAFDISGDTKYKKRIEEINIKKIKH